MKNIESNTMILIMAQNFRQTQVSEYKNSTQRWKNLIQCRKNKILFKITEYNLICQIRKLSPNFNT